MKSKYTLLLIFIWILFVLLIYLSTQDTPTIYLPQITSRGKHTYPKGYIAQPSKNEIEPMFDLVNTKDIGYPNCMGCFCYLNSSLQLFRTIVYPFISQIDPVIVDYVCIINKCDRILNTIFLYYITQYNPNLIQKLKYAYWRWKKDKSEGVITQILNYVKNHRQFSKQVLYYFNEDRFISSDASEFLMHLMNACDRYSNILQHFMITGNDGIQELIYPVPIPSRNTSLHELINGSLSDIQETSDYVLLSLQIFNNQGRVNDIKCIIDDYIIILEQTYVPISIVCHIGGSINGGHYVNYSRRPDVYNQSITEGNWYLYNDSYVKNIKNINKDLQDEGYIPFIIALKRVV